MFEGSTVTYTALQLAYFMGCDPVILIGVDHNFTTPGQPNVTVVSSGDDPNHFSRLLRERIPLAASRSPPPKRPIVWHATPTPPPDDRCSMQPWEAS